MARTGRRRRESHASGREVTTLPAGAPHTERAADYYASALGHTREERWSEATADLWRAIQLEPHVAEYHETLAWVLLKQHKSGSGPLRVMLQVIDRAIELDPDQHRALYLRSLILRRMGRLDDARTTLRRALKLCPDDPQIRRDLRDMLKQEQRETKSWIRRLLR
jgi:Flp pilus assembly protein TadD